MDWLCGYDVAGLFVAGGTGEFFSLTPAEVAKVVAVAVDETKGRFSLEPAMAPPSQRRSQSPPNARAPMASCCCRPILCIPSSRASPLTSRPCVRRPNSA